MSPRLPRGTLLALSMLVTVASTALLAAPATASLLTPALDKWIRPRTLV